jgi:hypothetical protein
VRSPHGRRGSERSGSQASFTSAPEDFWSADEGDEEDDATALEARGQRRPHPLAHLRPRSNSRLSNDGEGGESRGDQATMMGQGYVVEEPVPEHSRPPSSGSWYGGFAL